MLWQIDITLHEPFSCAARPLVANEMETTDYIPATTLRGALAAALSRYRRSALLDPWFSLSGPSFSNAWPLPSDSDGFLVPTPLSFVFDKSDSSDFDGAFGVYNTLFRPGPQLPAYTGPNANPHRHQWTRLRKPWLQVSPSGEILRSAEVDIESSMHVGLSYARQSVRGPNLYSREKVLSSTRFQAFVHDPINLIADPPAAVFLGKRRSAGNGAASLTWRAASGPFTPKPSPTGCLIQLLSDAILPDSSTGAFRRGLLASDLQSLFGSGVSIAAAAAATSSTGAWSTTWGLPRQRALTVRAGASYLLTGCSQTPSSPLARLGLRSHEGFGWLAVNPPWLRTGRAAIYTHRWAPPEPPTRDPNPWPGADRLSQDDLVSIETALRDFQPQPYPLLSFLAAAANRVASIDDWNSAVAKPLAAVPSLDQCLKPYSAGGLPQLRFALFVLLARLEKPRQ